MKLTIKERYARKFAEVASHIQKYSRDSTFNLAMKYLSFKEKENEEVLKLQNAQWLIFMLIKISSASQGVLKMNETDFERICNKLFKLQNHLIDVDPNNILLQFRPLIYQQLLLRRNIPEFLTSLARQCKVLGGNEFYESSFHSITKVGVASYFTIWLNIIVQATNKTDDGPIEINLVDLLYKVQKVVSMHEVVNFFVFFGIRYADLPKFFKQYSGSLGTPEDYYYDTPLKKKPFLLLNGKIYVFSEKLLLSCFPLLLIQTLKDAKVDNAKGQFGLDIEKYLGELLSQTPLNVLNEDEIKIIYRNNKIPILGAKVTDFAINCKNIVLVESKAIEQTDWLKVNTDPVELKKRLDQDFIKAVIQAEKCAMFLSTTPEFSGRDFKAIIVTYDDFGISTAASIKQLIGVDIEEEIRKECNGECPIPLGNVVYIPISDFEALCVAIRRDLISLDELIAECFDDQSFNAGMSLRKALTDRCGFDVYRHADELLTSDDSFINQLLKFNRSGLALNIQNPQGLISLYNDVRYSIDYWSQTISNTTEYVLDKKS
ncbi:hypothetical protein [Pseudomonas coleopterorum]|uniref:Uncharacterized protein n=1 Tax=Pseudomonas coleopterorum TaxID=1605838 RepID=A0ABR9C1N4_9PSED|nr:hypothetical protein [Pseudomonas coleopterorum]MBD8753683.1 hypothetical protein [Pseudomonas coleopterorum]MBD8771015.1 hypothetical protein [Pseudomonas coleopterorum]